MSAAGGGASGWRVTLRVLTKRIGWLLVVSMEYAGTRGSWRGGRRAGVRVETEGGQPRKRREDADGEGHDTRCRTGRDRDEPAQQGDGCDDREGEPAPAVLRRIPDRHDDHRGGE